jgi:hypothetical protein
MQKHEREAFAAAQEAAARFGCTVQAEFGRRGSKMMLVIVGPRGTRSRAVSSSPAAPSNEASFARQWVNRTASEVA